MPADEMLPPPVTDQVTAELKLPVPWTLAEHWEVAPVAMVDGEQVGATEEMVGEVACGGAAPAEPPQATTHERSAHEKTRPASEVQRVRVFKGVPRLVLGDAAGG